MLAGRRLRWLRLRVDRGDDPVRGHASGDAPGPVVVAGLDVLARDQRQQSDRVALGVVELDAGERVDDRSGIVHQTRYQRGLGVGVIPRAHRLARCVVVMCRDSHRCGLRDQPSDPADRRHQLRHGVLGRNCVVKQRRVQGPTALPRWHSQLCAWHRSHVSNGPTEANNNLIERVKRVAFGFRRFAHYRIRVLLYAGKPNWDLLATVTPR